MNTALVGVRPRRRRWPSALAAITAVLIGVASCEALGWPFLAQPMQRWLTQILERDVDLSLDGHTPASVRVRLLGRLRIEAPLIRVGSAHGTAPQIALSADDAVMTLRYADLWRARGRQALHVHEVAAAQLQMSPGRDVEVAHAKPCSLCPEVHAELTM